MEFNERDYVAYRGMRVKREWVDEIQRAQEHATYLIGGDVFERVAFGEERNLTERPNAPCPGCAVRAGEYHVSGCEYERCPACGKVALECDCLYSDE